MAKSLSDQPVEEVELSLRAMLTEYSSLRQETLQTINHRIQILTFTFGALSLILGGLLTRQIWDLLAGILSLLIVPQVAKASLLVWLGEYHRSIRAGRWLAELEGRINTLLDSDNLLGWEQKLIVGRKHMKFPYMAVVGLIMGIAYASSALGIYLIASTMGSQLSTTGVVILSCSLMLYGFTVETVFFVFFHRRWKAIARAE